MVTIRGKNWRNSTRGLIFAVIMLAEAVALFIYETQR
jgi:hypothetical protein